ncbi:MAG: hypothetical protein IRD7MM_02000 [Candidatus Midichloria mitochondrii]
MATTMLFSSNPGISGDSMTSAPSVVFGVSAFILDT